MQVAQAKVEFLTEQLLIQEMKEVIRDLVLRVEEEVNTWGWQEQEALMEEAQLMLEGEEEEGSMRQTELRVSTSGRAASVLSVSTLASLRSAAKPQQPTMLSALLCSFTRFLVE